MQGKYLEELEVGMQAQSHKTVSENDITAFAAISGDHNPIHLDEVYAKKTMFKTRIAHGMLTASYISAALGTLLPGPGSIYISQNLRFKAPVRIGDEIVTQIKITAIDTQKARASFETICKVNGHIVLEGEALLMVPRRPTESSRT